MSYATGYAGIAEVWPAYGYGTTPLSATDVTSRMPHVSTADVTNQIPQVPAVDVSNTVDQFAQGLAGVLQELVEPAALALGAMSGALLAGRAAMAATGVLAHAAVRAAEEQRCLLSRQESARNAAQQWESAAFAATRVNARRTVLAARLTRAARSAPPGSPPPPAPVLPPPVQPVGCRLDATREAVAEAEHAVERAEAELAVWECATAVTDAADPRDTAWQQILAERRRAGGPTSGRDTTWPAPARGADEEEVTSAGSGLLAALPADATAEDTEPVVTALDYALICARAGDGVGAEEHLEEARIFAAEAGRRVRLRGEALARAAAQLEFLTTEVPPDVEPRPPAEDIVAPLRKAVEEGRPLGAADHERVRAAVDERLEHLEHHYVRQSAAQLLEALAGGPAEWHETGSGARCITHAPPGWEPDHWIRITVRPDGIGLATHRAGPPSPLDTQRCAEAKQWAADFERAVAHLGLDCDFRFDSDVVAPGTPDDAARFAPGPSGREHERPGPHTRDDRRRRDDRPRHRRIDDRDDRDRRH